MGIVSALGDNCPVFSPFRAFCCACAERNRYFLSFESSRTIKYAKGGSCARGVYDIDTYGYVLGYGSFALLACSDMTVVLSLFGLYLLELQPVQESAIFYCLRGRISKWNDAVSGRSYSLTSMPSNMKEERRSLREQS